MEKLFSEILSLLAQISERLDALAEKIRRIEENQKLEASRLDIIHHRVISLEASLDHKLGIFGERCSQEEEVQDSDLSGQIG